MSFEQWLEAKGFGDGKDLDDTRRASLLACWKAEVAGAGGGNGNGAREGSPEQTMEQILAAARAEEDRKRKITEIVAQVITDNPGMIETAEALGRQAIEGKWPIDKLELEMLRARRPTAPPINFRHDAELTANVIECAVCITGGLQGIEKHYDERTIEAAHKRFRSGLGLADLVMTFARRAGYAGLSVKSDTKGILRAAFEGEIKAAGSWGPSTGGGLSGVLSNIANKFLRSGFEAVDTTWRRLASIQSFTDFKARTTYTLTGGLDYEQLAPGGEIKHGQLSAETYTNQLSTYARMIGISRNDLINDDLNALTGVSRRLGRGGATRLNKVFWGVFLNNSSFFTAGRGNVSTGAGSALSLAGLDAANQKFMLQTDPDGNPIGAMPAILLVPPALNVTAKTLMASTALTIGTGTAAQGSSNVWAGQFRVESSPYMQDATLTGNSAAAWYLLADPNDVPVIEVGFLNGNETPTVETAEADFAQLGIALRGYFDAGCALQEYRAGVRSAGS